LSESCATALIGLVVAVLSVAPVRAQSLPPPIAAAGQGMLQCYAPDVPRKTCTSLSGYKAAPGGVISNTALVLISKHPPITMETMSPVVIKNGQVCGTVRPEDLDGAKFVFDGRPFDPRQSQSMSEQMKVGYKPLFGHEICTAYVPDGTGFLARATLDGKPMAGADQRVIWVSPGDGYRVAP
jgi:hypothetical protein